MDDTKARADPSVRQFVPARPVCVAAFDYASDQLPTSILHHSLRVFLLAKWLSEHEKNLLEADDNNVDLLFIASICHDLGTTHHHNGDWRFEVEGADAAKKCALSQGIDEAKAHDIWTAVAVHTSPHIAERIHPLSRLVRLGVALDFREIRKAANDKSGSHEYAATIEADIPRLDIEKELGDAVAMQALEKRHKAPAASWPGNLLRAHLENPDWKGINRGF